MEERPIIKIEQNIADRSIEILGWLSVLGIWIWTVSNYSRLPEIIPIHYDLSGKADGFGGKGNILTLPIAGTILFVGLTILNKYPHVFNFPIHLTKENVRREYTYATRLLRYLKLIIVVTFGIITLSTIQNATGKSDGLGVWFTPLTLGLIFVPILYYIRRAYKKKQ